MDGVKKLAKYLKVGAEDSEKLNILAQTVYHVEQSLKPPHITKPFDYGSSYQKLLKALSARLSEEGMQRICAALAKFRPSLVVHLRTLEENALVLAEYSFQHIVHELQRILLLTGAPYLLWRRTGEVAWVSHAFTVLTGWPLTQAIERSVFELLDERAIIKYWEHFAPCVVERDAGNFRLDCALAKPDGKNIAGTMWITVKKDIFDIPLVIMGCFLPTLCM